MSVEKILIVDDDEQLARLTQLNLPKDQFDSDICFSAQAALKHLKEVMPDLIIMDVTMPEMDGWQTLAILKSEQETARIPVIMCTGKNNPRDIEKSFFYGAEAYVVKPIHFPTLLKKIASVLNIENLLNGSL
jgi:DNA-binding response OmpR family regulator